MNKKLKCVVSIGYYDFNFGADYSKAVIFMQTAELYCTEDCRIECHIYYQEVDDEEESQI